MNPVLFVTGEFLAGLLSPRLVAPGATVLDMGAGSGICAIFAAQWARRVVAVDLNPAAVRCARINVLLHRLEERVEVREGDLFAPVQGERFDLILFNPPYLPGQPRTEFERALWSTDVIQRFAAGLGDHLAEDGAALVLLSSIADQTAYLRMFCAHGFVVDVVARRNLVAEVLTVYRLHAG
jgi:release factor glutamine methyltransferase